MGKSRKTILNVLLIAFVAAFFVTPLGHYGKVLLNRMLAFPPETIAEPERKTLADYDWKLKDAQWDFFGFDRSEGRVVLINFWASWRLPCEAELQGIQELYDRYKGRMDFYIVTDEEREPVEAFMTEKGFTFPVTYLIIGEKAPFTIPKAPASYLIDAQGRIVIRKEGIADWDNQKIYGLLDDLIQKASS